MTSVPAAPAVPRARLRLIAIGLITALAGLALLAPAQGEAKRKSFKAKMTYMTRNVYLGADLGPALNATSLSEAVDGAGEIYNEIIRTNFRERAVPVAREIRKSKADLVGLQEVARWRVQKPSDGGAPPISPIPGAEPATKVKYDFLKLLKKHLHGKYRVVAKQNEFEGELPADTDGVDSPDDGVFGADLDARLTMRDVILKRKHSHVKAKKKNVKMGHYDTLYTADVGGVPITALRGWLSVDAKYKKGKRKQLKFRFVNTHLEAFGDPTIKEAQAKELTRKGGPLRTRKPAVLVGDLNSGLLDPHSVGDAGNSGTDEDQLAFKALKAFGMKDYGTGGTYTCCYGSPLDAGEAPFDHTIDHVLVNKKAKRKAKAKLLKAYVTGDDPAELTPSGLWPSDHGGAVSKIKFKGKKRK